MKQIDAIKKLNYLPLIFIKLNQKYSDFSDELVLFLPELEADIKSSALDASCSCKQKIMDHVRNNFDKCSDFLFNFLNDKNEIFDEVLEMEEKEKSTILNGRIVKTNMEEWKLFSDNLIDNEYKFRGFSVVKEGDDVLVFFL